MKKELKRSTLGDIGKIVAALTIFKFIVGPILNLLIQVVMILAMNFLAGRGQQSDYNTHTYPVPTTQDGVVRL